MFSYGFILEAIEEGIPVYANIVIQSCREYTVFVSNPLKALKP